MSYKAKYSNAGFANQKAEDFRQLTEKRGFMSKKIYFFEMYPSLIAYLWMTHTSSKMALNLRI